MIYNELKHTLEKIYKSDRKKLRTGTVLFGHLDEGRWHTDLQPPLEIKRIEELEKELEKPIPLSYKELLTNFNGCYLFDILRIAGKVDSYKGMSIEEEDHQPFPIEEMQRLYDRKKNPKDWFVFADSMVFGCFFAIDKDGQILQINTRPIKIEKAFDNMQAFLREGLEKGLDNMKNNVWYEFE